MYWAFKIWVYYLKCFDENVKIYSILYDVWSIIEIFSQEHPRAVDIS